jgi:hypothetical protein
VIFGVLSGSLKSKVPTLVETSSLFFYKNFYPLVLDKVYTGSILLLKNDLDIAGRTSGASHPKENPLELLLNF